MDILAIALVDEMHKRFGAIEPIITVAAWLALGNVGRFEQRVELVAFGDGVPILGKLLELAEIIDLKFVAAVQHGVLAFEVGVGQRIGNLADPFDKIGEADIRRDGKAVGLEMGRALFGRWPIDDFGPIAGDQAVKRVSDKTKAIIVNLGAAEPAGDTMPLWVQVEVVLEPLTPRKADPTGLRQDHLDGGAGDFGGLQVNQLSRVDYIKHARNDLAIPPEMSLARC